MSSGSSEPLNAADLRAKRLAALGMKDSSNSITNASASSNTIHSSTSSSSVVDADVEECQISNGVLPAFQDLMWDPTSTSESDQKRWFDQGIYTFAMMSKSREGDNNADDDIMNVNMGEMKDDSEYNPNGSGIDSGTDNASDSRHHYNWGISQTHGGPCGVLAVIQAEMIKYLELYDNIYRHVTCEEADRALSEALGAILARCSTAPSVQDENANAKVSANADGKCTGYCTGSATSTATASSTRTSCVKLVLPLAEDTVPSMVDFGCNNAKLKCALIRTTRASIKDGTQTPESKRWKAGDVTATTTTGENEDSTTHAHAQRLASATAKHLLENNLLRFFQRPGGVIILALSMIETRGPACIKRDMDDPTAKLTAQFGHSSQEFINLLLTGQATSNTFDNTMTLGGGALKCHGVQSQPTIGYLTQLEALRYCSVGSYFKTPRCPVWIVGSTSHFTVLFGPRESLEESMSDVILHRCRREFKSIEGAEDNGFIAVTDLEGILKKLDLDLGEAGVSTLGASIEMSGAGIILWSDFWKCTSRLLTGASLENVLQTTGTTADISGSGSGNGVEDVAKNEVALSLVQFGEQNTATDGSGSRGGGGPTTAITTATVAAACSAAVGNLKTSMESDEEMARRLAAEWGSQDLSTSVGDGGGGGDQAQPLPLGGGGGNVAIATGSQTYKSDEDLARELHAQFEQEDRFIPVTTADADTQFNDANTIAVVGDAASQSGSEDLEIATINARGDMNMNAGPVAPRFDTAITIEETARQSLDANLKLSNANGNANTNVNMEMEKLKENSFPMHHYNSLRGGILTTFHVTRLSAEEAVGKSVALSETSGDSGGSGIGMAGGDCMDLETVVRTKYPSCKFDWGGKVPPSLH